MKCIVYQVTYDYATGARVDYVAVFARDITSGFNKALKRARLYLRSDEHLHAICFWEVTS